MGECEYCANLPVAVNQAVLVANLQLRVILSKGKVVGWWCGHCKTEKFNG